LDDLIKSIATFDPIWIYATIFFVAYIENIFPPAPSDILVVFGGALAAMEKGNFLIAFFAGSVGGTLGFITMFAVGKWFGRKIIETGKIKFIKLDDLHNLEKWFVKWGFWIIVGNRFLSGTRAIVSFFAGMSELDFKKTAILSFISSSIWYAILVYAGYSLGHHWEKVNEYLRSYSYAVMILFIVAILFGVARYIYRRSRGRNRV